MQEQSKNPSLNINAKAVAKYALLPGVLPLLQRLVGHVSNFFFVFTQIFGAAGLIDRNHPCMRPENVGRYRFADIVGLAASNVILDRKHIPQTVMFCVIIGAVGLTFAIGLALLATTIMSVNSAHAQFFGEPNQNGYTDDNDWALQFLFRIFGGSAGMFPASGGNNPWFTSLLTGMLRSYSLAMMVVAAFMILYLLVITFVESAKTGQPFGTRFDKAWAPIRFALAMGLLMPITTAGYNGAQLITFQAAKWGSNLATNTWYGGVSKLDTEGQDFFSSAMTDPGYRFVRDIFLVNLCVQAMEDLRVSNAEGIDVDPVIWSGTSSPDTITYTFGPQNSPDFCGQVTVQRSPRNSNEGAGILGNGISKPEGLTGTSWPEKTIADYHAILREFLPIPPDEQLDGSETIPIHVGFANTANSIMSPVVKSVSSFIMSNETNHNYNFGKAATERGYNSAQILRWIGRYRYHLGWGNAGGGGNRFFQDKGYPAVTKNYNDWIVNSLKNDAKYGWTTAGVFYLRMSTAMSTISKVVNNPPTVSRLPSNLSKSFATTDNPTANTELIKDTCTGWWSKQFDSWFGAGVCKKYELSLSVNTFLVGGKSWFLNAVKSNSAAYTEVESENFDRNLQIAEPESSTNLNAGFIFRPIIDGLTSLSRIPAGDLNPLGAVITWGNTLMTLGFMAYGIALLSLGSGMASLAITFGNVLILPGFILAFWVPMMPFLYFTFAVLEWMMSILEAIIAMPLFALSFITLEGDGIGGAMGGVRKLFEIVLRPTIIVMSLLASILVFTAGVSFFSGAINLYAHGNAGANPNSTLFQSASAGFGMVFVYMFAIYTLATSCFKLISEIPNRFGRWMGLEGGFGSMIETGPESIRGFTGALVTLGAASGLNTVGQSINNKIAEERKKNGR